MEKVTRTGAELYAKKIMVDIGLWSEGEEGDSARKKPKKRSRKDAHPSTKFRPETVMKSLMQIDKE